MNTNFLNQKSASLEELAAINFSHFAVELQGVKKIAQETIPERLEKISAKAELAEKDADLLDQIGIDFLIEFMGVRFAVDVTTGQSTAIKNKKAKMKSISAFLQAINATPAIIQVRKGWTHQSLVEAMVRAPVCQKTGVIDCRI